MITFMNSTLGPFLCFPDWGNTSSPTEPKTRAHSQEEKTLQAKLQNEAGVNEKRVTYFKQLIAEGAYKMDAEKLADKLLDPETNLSVEV